ncbi:MAG: nucleotidyltransferase family protein [Cyanobacteriota bacterium]|nr:nucleotidyltransferase family protein [Cyanobacteriota bacterium]
MRPEIELLLCCTRTQLTPAQKARATQLVRSNLDWHYLLKSAQWHSLTPLLYWHLKEICPQTIPPEILSQLASRFTVNLQRNFFLTAQLLKILKAFKEKNILVIPFKGSILATTLYQNLALRQFYDIDLLIEKRDFFKAKRILEDCGYYNTNCLNYNQENIKLNANYEQDFFHPEFKIGIDLHWDISPPFFSINFPISAMLNRVKPLKLAGNKISVLSPEDSFIVLCVNGSKEGWTSLQRICDIAEFIQAYSEMNWDRILQKAEAANCIIMVLLGISLACELLELPVPKAAWKPLERSRKVRVLSEQVYERLFSDRAPQLNPTQLAYFGLQLQPGIWAKLRYCWKIALPLNERDLSCIDLPKGFFFLYYPLRLLRLILKYGLNGSDRFKASMGQNRKEQHYERVL